MIVPTLLSSLICNILARAGAKLLLSNARLWLKRGRRYGLCGANGTRKSTLMRAIANGQLDGFPPKEVQPPLPACFNVPPALCSVFGYSQRNGAS